MITLKFDDLYNAIVNEAPMTSYLTRPTSQQYRNKIAAQAREMQRQAQQQQQQQQQPASFASRLGRATAAAASGIGKGVGELAKGAGSVAGEAGKNIGKTGLGLAKLAGKAALNTPGAVKTARNFLLGDDPTEMVKSGIKDIKAKREEERAKKEAEASKIEEFDKKMVKSLLASQVAATSQQSNQPSNTTTGTVQAPGTVTGGNVASTSGASGTTSTSMQPTITPSSQSNLLRREPKPGDIFSLTDRYGRIKKYKVDKINGNVVAAKPVLGK